METVSKSQSGATLGPDLVAGVTTGIANIPDALASAILAGANPVQGLYAIMIGTPLGALLGGSAFMVVCATSAIAITVGDALAGLTGDAHAQATSLLALLVGIFMVVAGLLKLGRLLRFVSHSVVLGFLTGVSITIVLSQLGDFTGYASAYSNKVMKAIDLLLHLDQVHLQTTLIGLLTVAVILLVDRTRLGNFSMLIGMFAGSIAALLLNWNEVPQVGDIATFPTSLPRPQLPDLSMLAGLLLPAFAISVIGLVQGAGVSKAYANPDGNYAEPSRDFVGQGAANIGAGLLQGMAIGGSVSSTALNVSAGAKSRVANIFSGVVVALAVLLFSQAVSLVAMPAMAALLIVAGFQSIRTAEIADVWRIDVRSRLVWLVTLIMTLLVPLQWAVLVGVVLSGIVHILSSSQEVRLVQLVPLPTGGMHEQDAPQELASDSVTVLQMYGSLFYAAADRIEGLLPSPTQAHRPVVILRLRQQDSLSSTFIQVLERYTPRVQAAGGMVMLAGVGPKMMEQLEATNTPNEVVGKENVFVKTDDLGEATRAAITAAEAWLAAPPDEPDAHKDDGHQGKLLGMTTKLESWNDGAVKSAIIDFVARVTDETGSEYVPPADRIATFDNDGTLWCEKPMPVQIAGMLKELAVAAAQDPDKREQQPYKAAFEKDMVWFGEYTTNEKIAELVGMLVKAGAGETQVHFEARASAWFAKERHPRFGVPYTQVTYKPMVELLDYLRQNGFKVFICSGGGMDFMRLMAEEIYGVPREYVIGSNMKMGWEHQDGKLVLVREAGIVEPFNDGPGKPINIQLHVGRPPILVGGNSDGDIAMMEFAAATGMPYLNLLVHHDDGEREYAYDQSAEKAMAAVARHGWSLVSMKNDWKEMFSLV